MGELRSEIKSMQSPYILEEHELHATQLDIYSRLMKDRQIFFSSEVNDDTASIVIAQLLYLDSVDQSDITMYIMSPGGSCSAGLGIIDTIGSLKSKVSTINVGMAASMGCLIAAAGARGKRLALPNARFLIHQPLIGGHGITGCADDIEIEATEINKTKKKLFEFLSQRTGQPYDKIVSDAKRDNWLSAEEALEYGLIDKIIPIKWD